MSVVMVTLGGLLVAFVAYDAAVTTISSTTAAGPLTARLGRSWWRSVHRLARGPRSPLLSTAGPLILLVTIASWLALLWLGWSLVFAADPDAVVSSASGTPGGWLDKAYFAGFTVFTLGIGDQVPRGGGWQMLTVVATVSGLALTTAAITYLVPVVTAVTDRAKQANAIAGLGGDPYDIVIRAHISGSVAFLDQVLLQFTDNLLLTAQRHLAYPILHYFHPKDERTELRVQLPALDDALLLIDAALADEVTRPHPTAIAAARDAISEVVARARTRLDAHPPELDVTPLREAGIATVAPETFERRLHEEQPRRRWLASYAAESRWSRATATGG